MKLDYYYDPKNDLIFESEEHFKDYKKTKISFSSSKFKPEDFGLSIIEIESPDKPNTDILKKEIDLMTPKLQYPVDKYDLRTEEEINSKIPDTTNVQNEIKYVNALKELINDKDILLKQLPRQRDYM